MKPHTLRERGIEKPQGSRAKKAQAAKKLNGTKPIKAAEVADVRLTAAQRKQIIGEWLYLVNFVETVASNDFHAFAELTMTYVKFIVAKAEIPPYGSSPRPSDIAVDEFAQHMAAMMVRVLTEVLTEDEDAVRKRVMGGTLIQALGPRPQGPRSKGDAYPVSMPQIQARESVST